MTRLASPSFHARTTPPQAAERGMVLIYALIGMMVVVAIVLTSSDRNDAVRSLTETEFDVESRARRVAESGLTDALTWLQRQYEQPVAEFAPKRDMDVDPPVDETDDPSVGLVREYHIAGGYWGRYAVKVGKPAERFFDDNGNGLFDADKEGFVDSDGNGKRSMGYGCRDLSFDRGAYKSGIIWYLESEGSIYKRWDQHLPLGEGRNVRIAQMVLATEVRRLSFILPTSAAIVTGKASDVNIEGTVIESPILGLAYRPLTGEPSYKTLQGDTKRSEWKTPVEHTAVDGWTSGRDDERITCQDVFGVSMQTLRSMADYSVHLVSKLPTKGVKLEEYLLGEMSPKSLPVTIPEDSLTVITPHGGKLTVDKGESIIGQGIIVIDGDLDVKEDTLTHFSGLLFVSGDMKVTRAGAFSGTVIVGGKIDFNGELPAFKVKKSGRKLKSKKSWKSHKSKKSKKNIKMKPDNSIWVGHDPNLVSDLITRIGRYRRYKASFEPPYVRPDGRPDETVGAAYVGAASFGAK